MIILKICIVSVQWIPIITGGGGVAVVNLAKELASRCEVHVYCFGIGSLPKEEIMRINNVHIRVRRFFTRDSDSISNPFEGTKREEISRLREFIDIVSTSIDCDYFDVIHLHGHFAVPSMARKLRERGCGSRIITTIHAFESIIELDKGEFSDRSVLNDIVSMERDALEYSDIVTVGSRSLLEKIGRIHGEKYLGKIRIVHMGIEEKFFEPPDQKEVARIRREYAGSGYLILNINRLDPSKCIEYIIESMRHVAERTKDKKIALVIAGKYEERNRRYLEMLMEKKEDIETKYRNIRIYIMRNISEELKICLYSAADLFVMSSPTEPFGITILESLASGTPVIVTDAVGPREIFEIKDMIIGAYMRIDGGLMVNFSDPNQRASNLGEAITYALREITGMKKQARELRKEIRKKYSWKAIAEKFLQIFKEQ